MRALLFGLGLAVVGCGGDDFQSAPPDAAGAAGLAVAGGSGGTDSSRAGAQAVGGNSPGSGGMTGIVEESAGEGGAEPKLARGQPCEIDSGLECERGTYCDGYNCIGQKSAGGRCEFDAACKVGPCVEMLCQN